MFEVFIHDGQSNIPPDEDIYYIIGKDGIYLKKNLGLMESLVPVDKIPSLQNVQCSAVMHIPKIPATLFAKVYEFFKAVYEKHKSESIILIFYNQNTKKYKMVAPTQTVSGAACDYNKGMIIKDMTMIGTIHSHGNMSAFHSGTDDADEKVFDGLHITIGNVNDEYCSISTSVVANGYRAMFEESDYIEGVEVVEPVSKVINYAYTQSGKRYKIKVPPSKREFNPNWLKMVEKKTYIYNPYSPYTYSRYQSNQKLINEAWNRSSLNTPKNNVVNSNSKTTANNEENVDKCATCIHKKSDSYDTFEELYGLENDVITYWCKKCESVVDLDKDEPKICPVCLTDALIEFDEISTKEDNYEEETSVTNYFSADIVESKDVFTKCPKCANTFMYDELKPICPFCYTELKDKLENKKEVQQKVVKSPWSLPNMIKRFRNKGVKIE